MSNVWPVVARLNPHINGLDVSLQTFPKYDELLFSQDTENPAESTSEQGFELPSHDDLMTTVWLVLNGGETSLMRFSENYDAAILQDRLHGPEYKLSPKISLGDRDILAHIGQIASSFLTVRAFADHFSSLEYGKVNQALASAFRELSHQYLSILDETFREKPPSLYQFYIRIQPFGVHLLNAQQLISLLENASRQARERKRVDGATDLVERAATSQFLTHNDREAIISLRGGAVLRCLGELMHREMGDPVALNLYEELLRAASTPYLKMLEMWITKGRLKDPFEEFMVQETRANSSLASREKQSLDDYWDKRYTVRAMDVPLQLSNERIFDMLLVTGKFLNVLRDHDGAGWTNPLKSTTAEPIARAMSLLKCCETVEDPRVIDAISLTYKFANSAILDLLKDKNSTLNLVSLLQKLNEVFFLQSNLYERFVVEAGRQLDLPVAEISLEALERSLTQTIDSEDVWGSWITVSLAEHTLTESLLKVVADNENPVKESDDISRGGHGSKNQRLIGHDFFQFDFDVPFPLSMVVSRRAIVRYQFLFRHMAELMSVREFLGSSYIAQPKVVPAQFQYRPVSSHRPIEKAYLDQPRHWCMRAGLLRQRQTLFVDLLLAQTTYEGILPELAQFESQMEQFTEVSELVNAHLRFLDRSMMASLLSDPLVIKFQARLLLLCRQFVRFVNHNSDAVQYFSDVREDTMIDEDGNEISREQTLGWYADKVEKYESVFERYLDRFKERLEVLIPTDFVAGGSMQLLLRQLGPLKMREWDKYAN